MEQNTYIAQQYTLLQKEEHATTHINITCISVFRSVFYVKCIQAIYQRVFYVLILTSEKADHKKKMEDTL